MTAKELIKAVAAFLENIIEQGYVVCPVNMAAPIVDAGRAVGLCILGGAYDDRTQTRVLYIG